LNDDAAINDELLPGEVTDATPRPPPMWLPAQALNCYEGDARLRSWLTEPGLLTGRMRTLGGQAFALCIVRERTGAEGHLRAIELKCGPRVWLYAETQVPAATLELHPWLGRLQGAALGEVLARRDDVRREAFEFARLESGEPLIARALARAGLEPQALWVRRSRYEVGGHPFVLQEVFYPGTGVLD
jgi:chorismate lyase